MSPIFLDLVIMRTGRNGHGLDQETIISSINATLQASRKRRPLYTAAHQGLVRQAGSRWCWKTGGIIFRKSAEHCASLSGQAT